MENPAFFAGFFYGKKFAHLFFYTEGELSVMIILYLMKRR